MKTQISYENSVVTRWSENELTPAQAKHLPKCMFKRENPKMRELLKQLSAFMLVWRG